MKNLKYTFYLACLLQVFPYFPLFADHAEDLKELLGDSFITREEWSMTHIPEFSEMEKEVFDSETSTRVTLHHTVMSQIDEEIVMHKIYHLHRFDYNWADIGYHFVIAPSGRIYEGRDLAYVGAHTEGENRHNIGIAFMGCFDEVGCINPETQAVVTNEVSEEMIRSAAILFNYLHKHSKFHFNLDRESIKGRCEFPDTPKKFPYSPGNLLMARIDEMIAFAKEIQ